LAARVSLRVFMLWVLRSMRRIVVTVVGALLIVLGLIMIVTPGPGWLTVIAGLGVLSTEYTWARRALAHCKQRYGQAKDQVNKRRKKNRPPSTDV
jgi:uncharacterized protein (TIGR02611 family)